MLSGLGLSEILIIMLVTLVVIGPEKIPDVARMLGKGVREVRRASNMFRDMFMLEEGLNQPKKDRLASDRKMDGGARSNEVAGTVSRHAARPAMRPVRLEPARRATHVSEVAVAAADATDRCRFEQMAAPRSQ